MNGTKVAKKNENAKKFMAKFDEKYDYSISYKNDNLKLYHELKDKQSKAPTTEFGIFFAYSNEQFREGMAKCGYTDADKKNLKHYMGGYGTQEAWNKFSNYCDEIDTQIKEQCDPLEVLCFEYNNYECCLCGGLKQEVIDVEEGIFGEDATKEALKRFAKIGYRYKAV